MEDQTKSTIYPGHDGAVWVTTRTDVMRHFTEGEVALVAKDGTVKSKTTIKPSKVLQGYILISFYGKSEELLLLTAKTHRQTDEISFIVWTFGEDGIPANPIEIWKMALNHKIKEDDYEFFFEYSSDRSKILLASYSGDQYVILDSDFKLVWEGSYTKDKWDEVKKMTVTNEGNIGLLTFTNQSKIMATVKQAIAISCIYKDGRKTVSTTMTSPSEGYISTEKMYMSDNAAGEIVLGCLSFDQDLKISSFDFTVTVLNPTNGETYRKIVGVKGMINGPNAKGTIYSLINGHTIILAGAPTTDTTFGSQTGPVLVFDIAPNHEITAQILAIPPKGSLNPDLMTHFATPTEVLVFMNCPEDYIEQAPKETMDNRTKLVTPKQYSVVSYSYSSTTETAYTPWTEKLPVGVTFPHLETQNLIYKNRYYTLGLKGKNWCLISWE